ncbi:MAG: sulfite exporter TauE/SafE family protein [Oscillospiraceae bacterium]|nr:sulfite exporter TauE/SafE family protein [Oscillospiraceae bacterium]
MLNTPIISTIVGILLGFLTGLGTGGGSLLMLWLTAVLHMPAQQARTINLMFFLPCALIATILRLRKGAIPLRKLLLPALSGCIAAAVFSIFSNKMDTAQLEKLFGVLLLYTGIRELFYRPRKPK